MQRTDVRELLQRASGFHQRGRLAEAEQIYLQVLQSDARQFEAQHLLGVLRGQQGQYQQALDLVGAALRAKSDSVAALSDYGLILLRMGRDQEALASFDKALSLKSDHIAALSNRGNVLLKLGRQEEALASYDRTLALRPDHAPALYQRGNALAALRHYSEAIASYDRALAVMPGNAEALLNRGNALCELGHYEKALASYDAAIKLWPNDAAVLNNRGRALEELRRYEDALASYDRALGHHPGYAEALNNRGNVLVKLKQYDEALKDYDASLMLKPDYADALYNRGSTYSALRRYPESLSSYEQALALDPDDVNALAGVGGAALAICDWRRTAGLADKIARHVERKTSALGPFALLGHCDDPALLFQCARTFVAEQVPVLPPPLWDGTSYRHDKIRVAYLSADFRNHAVAYQLAELIELHDRSRFEVVGVCFGADDGSTIRSRLVGGFDRFLEVRPKSDRDVAQALKELQVDIAVDLMGHTRDARLRIFSHRPAPIQVNYLGFAGTTGADFIDYVIADPVTVPLEQQPFFSERIVHLPECFFVNDSKRAIAAQVPSRSDANLPEQGLVFCCFCNVAKIQPEMFDVWMRLLQQIDGSVLWLSARNPSARENLAREAVLRGVSADRLVFAGHVAKMEDHLARQKLADLFLDTLPYNAHATASDALWAGLPVLTCAGKTFAARVGASLITAAGIPELVTESLEQYEAMALTLAKDPARLASIRRQLEEGARQTPLFDTGRLCRHIEAAYTAMWERLQRGERPQAFAVPALPGTEAK